MNFKQYLQEKNNSSHSILKKIQRGDIPLSPKFIENTFDFQDTYCFKSIQIDRLQSAFKRQNKKNQVSTFYYFKEPEKVFWGVGQRSWYNEYPNNESCVVVMHGKITMPGTTDLWSFPDSGGRRWIKLNSIKRYNSELTEVLTKVQERALKNIKNPKIQPAKTRVTLDYDLSDHDKYKVITDYIDSMYESLSYYQNDIKKAINIGITQRAHYNEYVCYSYKVERVFLLSDDLESTKDYYPEVFKYNIEHKTASQISKELKRYQNEV
jgi:hypothetical protein